MKRVIFLISFVSACFCSCSQEEKKAYNINQYIFPEAKDVTERNFVEKLNAQIKRYDYEPVYYFRINKRNCLIEVYVNDILMHDEYEISNYITPVKITGQIIRSGPQRITVKMYPVGDLNNESWGDTSAAPMTHLIESSGVDISVVCIDEKSQKGLKDEKPVTQVTSPKEVAGKEEYEFSFSFNAEVPYEFEGWTKGQDLRKLGQELVRKKAVEFYEMVGQLHINKDLNGILKLDFPSTIRIKSSFYRNKENIEKTLEAYKDDVTGYDYKIGPIKDYTLEYMGNGKLLRLITENQNPELRGGGALLLEYGKSGIFQPGITLYLPQGRKLEEGFMMWK